SALAVEDQRLVAPGLLVDAHLEISAWDGDGAGDAAGGVLLTLAHVDQLDLSLVQQPLHVLPRDLADLLLHRRQVLLERLTHGVNGITGDGRPFHAMDAPQRPLEGTVVLVTGAGIRLGRAIAEAAGRAGASVAVHFHASEAQAEEVLRAIRADGNRAARF